ncbi:MAG: hypothetical protein P8Z49_08700, partial [Acidobacteriota bacterium]
DKTTAGFSATFLGAYLDICPDDAARQLDYARYLLLDVMETGKDRRANLLRARKAATLSSILTTDPEMEKKARATLSEVDKLLNR